MIACGPRVVRPAGETMGPTEFGSGTSREPMRSKPADRFIVLRALHCRVQVRRARCERVEVSGFWPATS